MTTIQKLQEAVRLLQEALREAEAKNAIPCQEVHPQIHRVLLAVSIHCGITVRDILGRSRQQDIIIAREIVAYILRRPPYRLSFAAIGRHLGGYHHTTILHNVRNVTDYISVNRTFAQLVESIYNDLK